MLCITTRSSILLVVLLLTVCSGIHIHPTSAAVTNQQEFDRYVQSNNQPVVIKFYAQWCGACTSIEKAFDELSKEEEFKDILFAHVDIDLAQDVATASGIVGVPTFMYFDQGTLKDKIIGIDDIQNFKEDMRSKLRNYFSAASITGNEQVSGYDLVDDTATDEEYDEEGNATDTLESIITPDYDNEENSAPESSKLNTKSYNAALGYEDSFDENEDEDSSDEVVEEIVIEEIDIPQQEAQTSQYQPGLLGFIAWLVDGIKNGVSWCWNGIVNLFK